MVATFYHKVCDEVDGLDINPNLAIVPPYFSPEPFFLFQIPDGFPIRPPTLPPRPEEVSDPGWNFCCAPIHIKNNTSRTLAAAS